jgi:hypothetical protein
MKEIYRQQGDLISLVMKISEGMQAEQKAG